ncbi:MAG: branched-chain amino acid ABC transporter permease [Nitrospinota bacterium]
MEAGVTLPELLQHLYLGLVQGCIFVLLSLGLSIIFGLMGIINFGHGVFYMLGAYIGYTILLGGKGSPNAFFFVALALTPVVLYFVGVLAERGLISRIYPTKNPLFMGVLVTFGLSIFLPDFVRVIWGRPGKSVNIPPLLTESFLQVGDAEFSLYRGLIILLAAVVVPLLWMLLYRTNLGMIIRAGTNDNEMVKVLGINVSRIWTFTFGLGIALAAFAGFVVAPLFAVDPTMGDDILIQTFLVVVVGGMGSFIGPVIGGLIVGQIWALTPLVGRLAWVETNLEYSLIGPEFWEKASDILLFLVLSIILLVRPRGLFGKEGAFD